MSDPKYSSQTPYIASYIFLKKDGKIAFIKRLNTSWMDGYYSLPAGKVEQNESYQECALRESKEEVAVTVAPEDMQHVLSMHRYETDQNNWMDCYFMVEKWAGEPVNAAPEKSSELAWLDPDNLPENVVEGVRFALQQVTLGNKYCEFGWEKR